ncbi:rhoptry protein ROP15 [Besnoitia besnoiti]|uniref:Rhoptry protein ROP15 n=1 Tax=Besnoitia besnoiti TaxID=94643 RepID=A0A2A9M2Y6_BESBE|nr:rhoptry protein ROP15 [Besnoitia besnoiti]PFH32325.1 rhoptry protein ROP15 [Besnoitia besnoiti]
MTGCGVLQASTVVIPGSGPGDSTLLGLVSTLPGVDVRKVKFAGDTAAVLGVTRNASWNDVEGVLKTLVDAGSRTSVEAKYNGLKLGKKSKFGDEKAFPQTVVKIVPQQNWKPLLRQQQKISSDDLTIKLFEIADECKLGVVQASISTPLTILIQDIPAEHFIVREFQEQAPHYLLQRGQRADLLLVIDRHWCAAAVKHFLQYHLSYAEIRLEVNGQLMHDMQTFEDEKKFPQVVLSSTFQVSSSDLQRLKSRSTGSLSSKEGGRRSRSSSPQRHSADF